MKKLFVILVFLSVLLVGGVSGAEYYNRMNSFANWTNVVGTTISDSAFLIDAHADTHETVNVTGSMGGGTYKWREKIYTDDKRAQWYIKDGATYRFQIFTDRDTGTGNFLLNIYDYAGGTYRIQNQDTSVAIDSEWHTVCYYWNQTGNGKILTYFDDTFIGESATASASSNGTIFRDEANSATYQEYYHSNLTITESFACAPPTPPAPASDSQEGNSTLLFTTPVNETTFANLQLNLTSWNLSKTHSVNLTYNGTVYTTLTNQTQNGPSGKSNNLYNVSVWVPLVNTNNTALNFTWVWEVNFTNGTTKVFSSSNSFNVYQAYLGTNLVFDSLIAEASTQEFNASLIDNHDNRNISYSLDINGTIVTFGGNNTYRNGSHPFGLVLTNNSHYDVNLSVFVQSGAYNYTRTLNSSVRVLWDYFITSIEIDSILLELNHYDFNMTYRNGSLDANISEVQYFFNGTEGVGTLTPEFSYANGSFTTPLVTGVNNLVLYSNLTVTHNGVNLTRNFNKTVSIQGITLTSCTAPNSNSSLTFRGFREDTIQESVYSLEAYFEVWIDNPDRTRNFSFDLSGSQNYTICLFPDNATLRTTASQFYTASGFKTGSYWLFNATLTNVTQLVDHFLANSSYDDVIVDINDQNDEPLSEVFVEVLKQYPGATSGDPPIYRTVEIARTDTNGQAIIHINRDIDTYILLFKINGNEVSRTLPAQILTNSLFFTFNLAGNFLDNEDTVDGITRSLVYDNTTGNVTFEWSDTSGVVNKGCLIIDKINSWGITNIAYKCVDTASGVLIAAIGSNAVLDGQYRMTGRIEGSSSNIVKAVEQFMIDFDNRHENFGTQGPFYAGILLFSLAAVGLASPIAMLVFLGLGLYITTTMGLLSLGSGGLIAIITLIAFAILRSRL